MHLQRLDEAQEAFETALRIFETNLGPHHMDVLGTRMNLAGVLAERGDLQGASAEYEQVLEAAEATLGRDHPQIAVILNNFADVEAAQGHHDVAQAMAARAITLVESSYGSRTSSCSTPCWSWGGVSCNRRSSPLRCRIWIVPWRCARRTRPSLACCVVVGSYGHYC